MLGANDGILSTASLVLGVAAAGAARGAIVTAGVAGLVAGATAMAAGEYVSVSSQRDTERADLALERRELAYTPERERAELAAIWAARGLSPELAERVADELSAGDRFAAQRATSSASTPTISPSRSRQRGPPPSPSRPAPPCR